ncbi:hypothetical protein EW146_g3571 [Bondarzewia mesenterica]|uniref:Uncharacterized protein n=1 Tax=Bondarzewia mesenterica TaxID=1095465 RepID=A0A4S4M316_9AGAM|nr:hypothetical protein EW146_g3571 [Bondarzewia mesenterica]
MAAQHRHQLSRLQIPGPSFHSQQPMQPMFSPGLPTAIQTGFHPPPYIPQSALQTPMQSSFFQPPGAPARPVHPGHRAHQSLALAAMGVHPPPGMPMTPLGQGQFSPGIMLGQGQPYGQQFVPRRRQPSVSTGGPPKAQLGGPGKNHRPVSPTKANAPSLAMPAAPAVTQKLKKGTVSFPRETISGEDGEPATYPPWARTPIPPHLVPEQLAVDPPESTSAEIYPPDFWRREIPDTVDVFLPGKAAWDDLKQQVIEEKLEKLGVEKAGGSFSNVPHIHAPHARAASISSPADPALLLFKLNKLQASQNASAAQSASTSPQPPFSTSPNPQLPPRFQNRHGHSLSLSQSPSFQSSTFNPAAAFNPFGPNATLGSDTIYHRASPSLAVNQDSSARSDPGAPTEQSLAPPILPLRADSRPDFVRGFGLDIPEEEEPPEDEELAQASHTAHMTEGDTLDMSIDDGPIEDGDDETEEQGSVTTAPQSRLHSRHVSRLSTALSLLSVGGQIQEPNGHMHSQIGGPDVDDLDKDAVGEWTGSEDLRTGEETTEDEGSIGEWSNPSDEERARQARLQRRIMRKAQQEIQTPRRLPNFPNPPQTNPAYAFLNSTTHTTGEDDMVSNPSEEEHHFEGMDLEDAYARPMTGSSGKASRPLPPLPSSRPESAQYSFHDPALAHSRRTSEQFAHLAQHAQQSPLIPPPPPIQAPVPKREALNPLAKPFVFGTGGNSSSWAANTGTFGPSSSPAQASNGSTPGHERVPSFGKPLNAAAAEFKPGQFTFRMPSNVPQLPLQPAPQTQPRPLPSPPISTTPVRATQGREKRQRRASDASTEGSDEDDIDNMTSFKFPAESPQSVRRSAPNSPVQRLGAFNVVSRPFTLSAYSNNAALQASQSILSPDQNRPEELVESPEPADDDAEQTKANTNTLSAKELPIPPSMKARRAPIPLDFKHPVSTNTVPAGLFKALGNGDDERTRRSVRSRLSSRDVFEHVARPSLDDLNVPAISRKVSRSRLVTDPGRWDPPHQRKDVFAPAIKPRRRSSLPQLRSSSSVSGDSLPAVSISRRLEMQQYEERLEALLDEKIEIIRLELQEQRVASDGTLNPASEAMINEVVSLFRAQLQESAARGLDDSQMDARGELDFQLVKDIVEQGHAEARALMQQDLAEILRRLDSKARDVQANSSFNAQSLFEEYHNRIVTSIVNSLSQLVSRLDTLERTRTPYGVPTLDREALVHDLMSALLPSLSALRSEPIDYEGLTTQLTQAVKPHISQLIDLAADKRETAGLIVDRLIPILPTIYPPPNNLDMDTIISQISVEVRKVIAPVDAHEIKEQVSDLVVERLDSRLAVRDRVLEGLPNKVADNVEQLLEPVRDAVMKIGALASGQDTLILQTRDLESIHRDVLDLLSDLPERLSWATEALGSAQAELRTKGSVQDPSVPHNISHIESTVDSLANGQQSLEAQSHEILAIHQELLSRLIALPETIAGTTRAVYDFRAELLARSVSKQDFEEVRKLITSNAELQVQLAKARGAHGSIRVEKDVLEERVTTAETECDRLRAQVEELQANMITRATEAATSEARNAELEEALSQALARLKTSDVATQTQQERIVELEKDNHDAVDEVQSLKSQLRALEMQTTFAVHDKEAAVQSLASLRMDHDSLLSQQAHWDDFRRTADQVEMIASLVSQNNDPELKELRRIRDRSKALEGEFAALQRRYKDQENKATSSDRAAAAARQSLIQAQQRSAEWEKRANEYQVELEETRTRLDQVEEKQAQLDTDYSLAKLQLEEKEADERLAKDREHKLRDQVAALDAKVTRLQAEPRATPTASTNGAVRSASRALSTRTNTPPQSQMSVWDSMHAPKARQYPYVGPGTPKARPSIQSYYRPPAASPTPSVVSVTPTQGEDGWWE